MAEDTQGAEGAEGIIEQVEDALKPKLRLEGVGKDRMGTEFYVWRNQYGGMLASQRDTFRMMLMGLDQRTWGAYDGGCNDPTHNHDNREDD